MKNTQTALVATASEERLRLLAALLESVDAEVLPARTCREARLKLQGSRSIAIVITDTTLPDGNWCNLFHCVSAAHTGSRFIVCSEVVDEHLKAEATWRGVFDLLPEPCDKEEAKRVVVAALKAGEKRPRGDIRRRAMTQHAC